MSTNFLDKPPTGKNLQSQLEPVTRAFVEKLLSDTSKPLPQLSPEEARNYMRDSQSAPLTDPSVTIKHGQIAGIPAAILRPANTGAALPAVLYLHGGGWMLGGIETHARIAREICLRAHAVVVVPEYTRTPEERFPIALEQCYAVAQALQESGAADSIDGTRLAVAGDSAGGNLAAALALLAARRGGLALCLQALICPALQAGATTPSYAEFATGLNLTAETMQWFWQQYVPDRRQWNDPLISPLNAAAHELALVAPAWIATPGCDILRDEGEQFAKKLWAAGNSATAIRYAGTIHNFPIIDALQHSGPAIAATAALGHALHTALHNHLSAHAAQPI